MAERPRWDTDPVGRGVRDAVMAQPAVVALLEVMAVPGWIAEDPELQLLPHIQTAAKRLDVPIASVENRDGILEVSIEAAGSRPEAPALALALVAASLRPRRMSGSFAR